MILTLSITSSMFNDKDSMTQIKRYKLWRFFQRPVVVKLRKHVLNSCKRIGKLAVVKDLDRFLDPLEKVRRQSLVVGNHLIVLSALVEHLIITATKEQTVNRCNINQPLNRTRYARYTRGTG